MTDEHYDGSHPLESFNTLREAIRIMKHNYLQLLVD